jgi:hypothetical protein
MTDRLKPVTQEKNRLKPVLPVLADFFALAHHWQTTKGDGLPTVI